MAHQIFQDRRMFYAGTTPWHGLGTKLPENARWADVAHLFPRVDERPVLMPGGVILPDVKALVCSGDGRYLATVGADYKVVQAETIASVMLTAAADAGAIFHTGGVLGERGNRGWLLGELPRASFTIGGDSPVRAYFLGYWGHDGRTGVTLRNVATRVVCQNTVSAALGERGGFRVNVRHTSGAEVKLDDAARTFRDLHANQVALRAFAEKSAAHVLTRAEVEASLDALFPRGEDDTARDTEKREASMGKVVSILGSDTVPVAIRHTAWGLMQAASEFAEHFTARVTDAQRQLDSLAARQLDSIGDVSQVYATIARVTGIEAR